MNRVTKILFYGTNLNSVIGILSSQFRDARVHIIGKGVYLQDILDYAWYFAREKYRCNFANIPKVGETFSVVGSEIYYDNNKIEKVYDTKTSELSVQKYGIRYSYSNYETRIMTHEELQSQKGFIGTDILITDKNQNLPLYGITLKRIEYLVIWRDYNFEPRNPNCYDNYKYKQIQEFHNHIKKIISWEYDSKVYYIKATEEALDLIDRKKYNKIIIITNGSNNANKFIKEARKIIGANTIAVVSSFNISSKIKWIKELSNILILNGISFHERFFKCIKEKNIDQLKLLRRDIINKYSDIPSFNLKEFDGDLFNFVNFKNEGSFGDLIFK